MEKGILGILRNTSAKAKPFLELGPGGRSVWGWSGHRLDSGHFS